MSEPLMEKRPTTAVKCEKHGLHYNPATMDGCVICRREAGGGTAPVRSGAAAAPSGSMGQALAVTAILLLLTTACLYLVHGMVAESFQGTGEANALEAGYSYDEPVQDAAFPEEDTGGPVYSGPEGD